MESTTRQRAPGVNILKEWKLALTAPPAENAVVNNGRTMSPTLKLSVVDNQPRLTVYTNVKDDANKGMIEGNMDAFTFGAVMEAVRKVARDATVGTLRFQNKGYFYKGNERSEQPGVKSTTMIGRDSESAVYIACIAGGNRPNIRFRFEPSEWHGLVDAQGNPPTLKEISEMYAVSYSNIMERLVCAVMVAEYITPDEIKARKEANRNNGGKGNWNNANRGNSGGGGSGFSRNGGNGGGNYRNNNSGSSAPAAAAPAEDFSEDIPW